MLLFLRDVGISSDRPITRKVTRGLLLPAIPMATTSQAIYTAGFARTQHRPNGGHIVSCNTTLLSCRRETIDSRMSNSANRLKGPTMLTSRFYLHALSHCLSKPGFSSLTAPTRSKQISLQCNVDQAWMHICTAFDVSVRNT